MHTLALQTRTPRRRSKPSENTPSPLPALPEAMRSLCFDCSENRLSDLQNRFEKWCNRISLFLRMGIGRVCRWLNSIGIFSGSLQTTLRLTEDQQMLWAEPHDTWSINTVSGIGIRCEREGGREGGRRRG